jgi:TonB family protein
MTPTQTGNSTDGLERRRCARHQVKSLAYMDIGADNGGIVLNISESGLAVHAVSILPPDPIVDIRLQLHKSNKRLETRAKVAWTSETKKEAGIEFIDLPEEVRLEIKEWLALENLEPLCVARGLRIENPPATEQSLTRRTARTDKWTNLVSELMSIPAGIDRAVESPRTPARPGTVTESMPGKETAAPLNLGSILAGEESETDTPERDFGRPASLLTDSKLSTSESDSIASHRADYPVSPNPNADGNVQYRGSGAEFSLPSDKLLSSPRRSGAIPPNQNNKNGRANGSQNNQEPDSSTPHGDDFLKKAREVFGPKGLARTVPGAAQDNAASSLNSAETAPTKLRSQDYSKEHVLAPASGLIATSALPSEASIPNSPWPLTSAGLKPDARFEEPLYSSTASPPERSLDLRSFVGLFALCVLLSVLCLALGVVVGRSVTRHSPSTADSSDNGFSQRAPTDVQNNKNSDQSALSAATSHGQNGSRNRNQNRNQNQNQKLTRERPSTLNAVSHRASAADRSTVEDVVSPENDSDQPPADRSTVQGNSQTLSAENASSNGAPIAPPPAAAVSATAPAIHAIAPPNVNAAPRTQPPSDRLVPAHLIYRVEAFYPKEALQQRVEGTVKIHATVGPDGRVKNLRVVSGPASLTAAALSAAQYWRYVPALRNGEPIDSDEDISIEFHLLH